MKQIHLRYQLKDLNVDIQSRVLYNNLPKHTVLFREGKELVEFHLGSQTEQGRTTMRMKENKLKDSKMGIGVAYASDLDVYFILYEGWCLDIYTRQLHFLKNQKFESKFNLGVTYYNGSLLLVGVEGEVNIIQIEIELLSFIQLDTNVQQTKFVSSMRFDWQGLKKIRLNTKELQEKRKIGGEVNWNIGYQIENDLIYLWSNRDLTLIKFNGNIQAFYPSVSKKENVITVLFIHRLYNYVLLGYQVGSVKVWSFNVNKMLIHKFDGHTKEIIFINTHIDERLVWTASSDLTIRLNNLDVFQMLYVISLSSLYRDLFMLDNQRFIVFNEQEQKYGYLNNNLYLLNNINAGIICSTNVENKLILTLDNNSAIMYKSLDQDISKTPYTGFSPPPQLVYGESFEIQQMELHGEYYGMLMDGGTVAVGKLDDVLSKLMFQINELRDFDRNIVLQKICQLQFTNIRIPSYDCDFGLKHNTNYNGELLILGMSKGSIIVIDLLTNMHARMSFHRERIVSLCQVHETLISLCIEGFLKITNFIGGRIQCLRSYNAQNNIESIQSRANKTITITHTGPFQVFKLQQDRLKLYSYDKGNEHESKILSLDYFNKCYITAASDQKIKIWSSRKILLIQLNVDEELQGAWCFNSHLIIAHTGKLSALTLNSVKLYSVNPKQTNKSQKEVNHVYFDDYFSVAQQRKSVLLERTAFATKSISVKKQNRTKQQQVGYIGGRIEGMTILSRGKVLQDSVVETPEKAIVLGGPKKNNTADDYFHDWEALHEYENNRKNRFQIVSALPKLAQQAQSMPKNHRIMTRRDLTLNRILMQSILQ